MQIKNLTVMCFAAGLLAACSSVPQPVVAPSLVSAAVPAAPATAAPTLAAAPAGPALSPLPEYLDPKSLVSTQRSVFFGFDDTSVTADNFAVVERQGRYLAANPRLKVTIEGNTDERGGAEYNLALGQKRADAVLRSMKVYGAGDSQMEATSWGREKPRATAHDEAAWAQNRRADVVYPVR
jgi:peptidoglycan-associated lipoprotein